MLEIRSLAVTGRLLSTTFSIRLADAIVITGPNGSGKSTLLDCISGVLKPSSGVVSIENKVQPAYLPQLPPRPFAYTVREYLMVGDHQITSTKFNAMFDVDSLMDKEITSLSAGQWQRVAITKVMSQPSSLVLLDEPDAPLNIRGQSHCGYTS